MNVIFEIFKGFRDGPTILMWMFVAYITAPIIERTPELLALVIAPVVIIAISRYSIARDQTNNFKFSMSSHALIEAGAIVVFVFGVLFQFTDLSQAIL